MRQLKITRQITARDNDSLERYLHDVAQQVMITPDEEVQLARRIKLGDTEALEKMTKPNNIKIRV
jgi:RNA polymerase primary sigma factor